MAASRRTIVTLIALLVALCATAVPAVADPHPDTYPARDRDSYELTVEAELLRLHNEARESGGAEWGYGDQYPATAPLSAWTDIRRVARGWAEELAETQPCEDPDDPICHNMAPNSGFPFYAEYGCYVGDEWGENTAGTAGYGMGYEPDQSAEYVARNLFGAWIHSPGHRREIMDPNNTEFAVGVHVRRFDHPEWGPSTETYVVANFRGRAAGCDVDGERYFGPDNLPDEPEPGPRNVAVAAGSDRIDTAIELGRWLTQADTVLLANAYNYPDALAAATLAGVHDAPLLLTGRDHLDSRVAEEIDRLGASTVLLLGGTAVLSDQVRQDASARPSVSQVDRVSGANRYATAALIAERALTVADAWDGSVILVEGSNADPSRGWPDALAASGYAARTQTPILLTLQGRLPDVTRAALRDLEPTTLLVVGGTSAVSDAVAADAAAAAGLHTDDVVRLAGTSRYRTSMQVDGQLVPADGPVFVATGLTFADALPAGPMAAVLDGTLLLIHGQKTDHAQDVVDYVDDRYPSNWVIIVGGEKAVSSEVTRLFQ